MDIKEALKVAEACLKDCLSDGSGLYVEISKEALEALVRSAQFDPAVRYVPKVETFPMSSEERKSRGGFLQ